MAEPTVPGADLSVPAPAQAGTLGHRGSEDLTTMLQQAVSALHDDDLLLSGGVLSRWPPLQAAQQPALPPPPAPPFWSALLVCLPA